MGDILQATHSDSSPITGPLLRQRRLTDELTARAVATRAGLSIGRLSKPERALVKATPADLGRISKALDELIVARKRVAATAAGVGWPL